MKKFLVRILIFGIIFILNALFIVTVDAYNVFFDSNFIADDYKKINLLLSNEAMPRGSALWKLNEFTKHPCPNIILGDSRARGIKTKLIKEITDEEYYNFGIPGGNYKTIIDVFWFANDHTQLKKVVIQVGFHTYTKKKNFDLVKPARQYLSQPVRMFFNSYFTFDSFKALKYQILDFQIEKAEETNEVRQRNNFAKWDQILQKQGYSTFKDYEYPDNYYNDLRKISDYCHQNNINLTFIVFPSHPDFFQIVEELDLSTERKQFISDITEMGETIDYSSSKNLISNKMLYIDLYHLKDSVIDSLIYEIWHKRTHPN